MSKGARPPFIFFINLVKNQPTLITFGIQCPESNLMLEKYKELCPLDLLPCEIQQKKLLFFHYIQQ